MDTTLSDPVVDRLLDGRYAVASRLARGGMASVYLATDVRLDRRVAVKLMHPGLAADPEFVARFNREARAAAALSHPDVVAVYDQGTDQGDVFLVMEYVDGHTPPFTADTALALAYRHVTDEVPPPSARVEGIPPELDALVLAATAREPEQRPADARALHASLVGLRDRLGLHGAVPAPPDQTTD